MPKNFAGEKFGLRESCENELSQLFTNRDESFYETTIYFYFFSKTFNLMQK